jgi:hypothetical protein
MSVEGAAASAAVPASSACAPLRTDLGGRCLEPGAGEPAQRRQIARAQDPRGQGALGATRAFSLPARHCSVPDRRKRGRYLRTWRQRSRARSPGLPRPLRIRGPYLRPTALHAWVPFARPPRMRGALVPARRRSPTLTWEDFGSIKVNRGLMPHRGPLRVDAFQTCA